MHVWGNEELKSRMEAPVVCVPASSHQQFSYFLARLLAQLWANLYFLACVGVVIGFHQQL